MIQKVFTHIYLIIAASILLATTLLQWASNIFRNIAYGRSIKRATIYSRGDAIEICLSLPRPWKVQAGQYIYLCIPGVSYTSFMQSHPFMITWWNTNMDRKAESVNLLIEPKTGFTKRLRRHQTSGKLLAWVDGPYGAAKTIRNFGTVLMFATSMGIAAQLPYIKKLVKEYQNYNTSTHRITLIWQLNKESDQSWVGDWMNELLEEDDGSYVG